MTSVLLVFIVCAASGIGLIQCMRRLKLGAWFIDHPNERSLHQQPIPRIGGIAVVGVTIAVLTLRLTIDSPLLGIPIAVHLSLIICLLILLLLGMTDDRSSISALTRAAWHLIAAIGFTTSLILTDQFGAIGPTSVGLAVITVLVLGWSSNLYNFMDGANGLAGTMALIGFGALALAAPPDSMVAWAGAAISGAALGFLVFNWDPAKVFLGDAGSVTIGFAAAAFGLIGVSNGYWHWWYPVACFLPFIFDATTTLLIRLIRGEIPWKAHREHAYQRLIMAGFSHRQVAISYGLMSLICRSWPQRLVTNMGMCVLPSGTVIMVTHISAYQMALRPPQKPGC